MVRELPESSFNEFYDRTHFGDGASSLLITVPVDHRYREIKDAVTSMLPNAIGYILTAYGQHKTIETRSEEGVPLFPAAASVLLESAAADNPPGIAEANMVYDALTDSRHLQMVHLSIDQVGTSINNFNFTLSDRYNNDCYSIESDMGEDPTIPRSLDDAEFFVTHHYRSGQALEKTKVDRQIVSHMLEAILFQQNKAVAAVPDIEGKLRQIIELAPTIYSSENADYELQPSGEAKRLLVSLSRLAQIATTTGHEGIENLFSYDIEVEEVFQPRGNTTISHNLSLSYSAIRKMPHKAKLAVNINGSSDDMPIHERDTYFNEAIKLYVARPQRFFRTLGGIANRLAKYGPIS